MTTTSDSFSIVPWPALTGDRHAPTLVALDAIFFEASATKTFASPEIRAQFRERWLGRYLAHDPRYCYLAFARADGQPDLADLAGYLVGCLDDPARTSRFADIATFAPLAAVCRAYPAHLHVNLAPAWRGIRLGERLVERFCLDAAAASAPGVHVVTGAKARNVGFYNRLGFLERARLDGAGPSLVFLARGL